MEFFQFAEGQLAGEDDALDAQILRESGSFRRSDGHLRAGVDGEGRSEGAGEADQADVLHNERIDTTAIEEAQVLRGIVEFRSEDERVEDDVRLDAVAMAKSDD